MGFEMNKIDHPIFGVAVGILGTLLGFMKSSLYKDSILTISVLFNVGLFWLCLRSNLEQLAKGILAVIFVSVPVIIYYQATTL